MPSLDLRGVLPPVATPFDRDEIDLPGLRSNVERYVATGLAGLVVLGSNGEAPLLDDDEADRVVDVARVGVPRDRLFIVGVGRESTRATIAAARRAAALGADAVLVRTPSFFKGQLDHGAFVAHYTAVADATPVPLVLYNFAALTGVNLHPTAVARLAEHPNIAGMKESSGDIAQVQELISRTPAAFSVVVGNASTFFASLAVGARGGVLALACVVPDLCLRLYDLTLGGRHDEARALQQRLTPLARLVGSQYGVPGLKAALDLAGFVGGDPRPPLGPVPAGAVEEIREQLVALQSAVIA